MLSCARFRYRYYRGSLSRLSLRFCWNETEEWRDIDGFSMYQVSSLANVKNRKFNKLLTINIDTYKKLNLGVQAQMTDDKGQKRNV